MTSSLQIQIRTRGMFRGIVAVKMEQHPRKVERKLFSWPYGRNIKGLFVLGIGGEY
jgi:hypothetical protein